MLRRVLLALLIVPTAAAGQQAGDAEEEHAGAERARLAVARGEILPLADILSAVEARYEGRVIATELTHRHGRWIYQFKLLPQTGHIARLCVDAATGAVVEAHGPAEARP